MITPGFIEAGLAAIRGALVAAADKAGLTLRHYPVTRSAARRFRASLRLVETMLRRLLVLMAAELPGEPARPALSPAPQPSPCPAGTIGEPEAAPARKRRQRGRFTLLPEMGMAEGTLEALRTFRPRRNSQNAIGTLLERYQTLLGHLSDPAPLARRMARALAAIRAEGGVRPVCARPVGLARMGTELGLVAAYLPDAVNEALAVWFDTG